VRGLAVLACLWACTAQAQIELRRRVRVDFYQGPVVSASRVMGLGGAYVSIAEGADGHLVNPAAFAVRSAHTADEWYDWDVSLSWLNVAPGQADLDQSGRPGDFESAQLAQVGVNLKFGRHGFGVHLATQTYTLERTIDSLPELIEYGQSMGGPGYAYAFWDGALTVGVVFLGGTAEVSGPGGGTIAKVTGAGSLLGALYSPPERNWRLGATLRSEVIGKDFSGEAAVSDVLVPGELVVPWEVAVGASYLWGARHYNRPPTFGDEGKAPAPPPARRGLLMSADVLMTGPVEDAVSARAFLDGDGRPSGEEASLSLRMGAEMEILPERLAVRAGSYYEPSRLEGFAGRFHGTAGADLHIEFGWNWKVAAVIDAADDYLNWGLGLGFWH
jgi:hypothetical protein